MKKQLKKIDPRADEIPYGGIPMINNKKGMWVDNSDYHNLIIGSTGAGKTQVVVNPLVKVLSKAGESMIITDPKGEIYEENANMLREKGYNVVLLNFRNPQQGSGWNPLTLPYDYYRNGNQDKAIELVDDLAVNILYDENAQNQVTRHGAREAAERHRLRAQEPGRFGRPQRAHPHLQLSAGTLDRSPHRVDALLVGNHP